MLLEVTPPWDTKQSLFSTEQLFTTIHTLGEYNSFLNTLLGRKKTYSFEIVSTKNEGIRYLIRVPYAEKEIVKNNITAFLQDCIIREVSDYLPSDVLTIPTQNFDSFEFRQISHFAIPLTKEEKLSEFDPIAYITNHMTGLTSSEFISLQLILSPVTNTSHRRITSNIKNILELDSERVDIFQELHRQSTRIQSGISFLDVTVTIFLFIILTPVTFICYLFINGQTAVLPFFLIDKKTTTHTKRQSYPNELQKMIIDKLDKPLFEATLRISIKTASVTSITERLKGLHTSLSVFQNGHLQRLAMKNRLPALFTNTKTFRRFQYIKLKYRLLSFTRNPILSITEASSLYHFPYFPTVHTEGIITAISPTLAPPISLQQQRNFSITFAQNSFRDEHLPIGLTLEERSRHVYIIGATGTGKSTLLTTMILEDLKKGNGVCVIDPHGELITQLTKLMPDQRIRDTILFDPASADYAIGLNLLAIPKSISGQDRERYKREAVSALWSVFTKLYAERYLGPRMEYIIRNTALTAFETRYPSLITMLRLLVDTKYRKSIVTTITDPALLLFWKEFNQAGSMQRASMISPITNKLGKFLSDPQCARILGQRESTIDFEEIMEASKVLLVDVSKGKIGEEYSLFFGSLVTAMLELAAQRRIRRHDNVRTPFFLYIDEFQNFAGQSFASIMSESRKYGLYATLAHQSISQIEERSLINIILANSGTIISFRTGSPIDEDYILPYFRESLNKAALVNLPSYHFYIKKAGIDPQPGFSGETILPKGPQHEENAEKIFTNTIRNYAKASNSIEKELTLDFGGRSTDENQTKASETQPVALLTYLEKADD